MSGSTGESVNWHLVEAVRAYVDAGGAASDERIAGLERDVTRAVTAFADAAAELDDLRGRLERLERLARQSGADF